MGARIRVVVADGRAFQRAGLGAALSQTGEVEVAGEAGDGERAVAMCTEQQVDVLVLGVDVAGGPVEEWVRRLAEGRPRVRVLVLDRACDLERLRRLLAMQGAGYALESDGLVEAVWTMARAGWWVSRAVVRELVAAVPRRVNVDLTGRERTVMEHVVADERDQEIAKVMHIAERTVQGHLGRIYDKLGVRTRAGAAARAVAWGLVKGPAEDPGTSLRESAAESAGKHVVRRRKAC